MSYTLGKDLLKGKYKETFLMIEDYAIISNLTGDLREERLMNLLDVFVTAQENNDPIEKIVGNDLYEFTINYLSDITFKDRFIEILKMLYMYAVIYLGSTLFYCWQNKESFFKGEISYSYLLTMIIIYIAMFLSNSSLRFLYVDYQFKHQKKVPLVTRFLQFLMVYIISMLSPILKLDRSFLHPILIVFVLIFSIYLGNDNMKKYGQLFEPKDMVTKQWKKEMSKRKYIKELKEKQSSQDKSPASFMKSQYTFTIILLAFLSVMYLLAGICFIYILLDLSGLFVWDYGFQAGLFMMACICTIKIYERRLKYYQILKECKQMNISLSEMEC